MKFEDLLALAKDQPFFETGLLLAGKADPNDVRRQLSRWTQAGKLRQLRRGLYAFAPPYQNFSPHPFLIANALVPGSYVSGQSALAYYGMIPEYAPRAVSVTTSHPSQWEGGYVFRHLAPRLFFGYQSVEVAKGQRAFVAYPEKALLDLTHLTPNSDSMEYLTELRLQNLDDMDVGRLNEFTERSGKPKWRRVAKLIADLKAREGQEYEVLP